MKLLYYPVHAVVLLNWQALLAVWYNDCVSCSFGTGLAGKMVGKILHTNYCKKQNSWFPQSVFKIYSQLLSLVTFIINRWQGVGRCIENLFRKPQGKLSVHRHIMAVLIVLRWILTWFDLRPNDKICECDSEHLISINTRNSTICVTASIMEFIFNISPVQNPMNTSHVLCPVVLFCSLLWPVSTTSK
jgi:hypothetical protein